MSRRIIALEDVARLDLRIKAELTYGDGFWKVRGVDELKLKPFLVADGPHGLRKQCEKSDQLGLAPSHPATCFPTASLLACSFDEELVYKMAQAIAEEAIDQGVSVVLGPGVNIKRNPLCGRNFEYYSEDPLLSGKMGAAFIRGVQSLGVGASLKHYAANNQETDRLSINALIDQRALHDLYLKPFEIAVKEGKPYTVMCSYNRINGTYSSDNAWLLNTILREQWGFDGLVMTDWGAINDDFLSRKNGMDLEMPGIGKRYRNLIRGIKRGHLSESDIDLCAKRVIDLNLRLQDIKPSGKCDYEEHFQLARHIATESSVLLKNSGILPFKSLSEVAIIGAFASTPRYQGTGSSRVYPHRLESFLDALKEESISYSYAPGYKTSTDVADETLEKEALSMAATKETIIFFAGLPDVYESEGFDRASMKMPQSHLSLIDKLIGLGKKIVIILQCGAPCELPFEKRVDAILLTYLAGEASGRATLDIILGRANPSGKLSETWPLAYADTPSAEFFPGDGTNVLYKEGIYVGYRYFDTVGCPVLHPFGYGLSFTEFAYANLEVRHEFIDGHIRYAISCDVTNIGAVDGKEIVQLYVQSRARGAHKPIHELRGFKKIALKAGQSARATFHLSSDDLMIFDLASHQRLLEKGDYAIEIGASARDIRLSKAINVASTDISPACDELLPTYYHLPFPLRISDEEFAVALQDELPVPSDRGKRPYTKNSTLRDLKKTLLGKILIKIVKAIAKRMKGEDNDTNRKMFVESAMTMPLRGYTMSGLLSNAMVDGLVHFANRHLLRGLWCMIFKRR